MQYRFLRASTIYVPFVSLARFPKKVNVGEVTLTAQAGNVYYYDCKITRTAIGFPSERGGGGLPGTTHEMSAKDPETVDSVGFVALDANDGERRVKNLPLNIFAVKP